MNGINLREHAVIAAESAFATVCLSAAVSAVGWVLYLSGWIATDQFVALLRFVLAFAFGGVVLGIPASMATTLTMDALRNRRAK